VLDERAFRESAGRVRDAIASVDALNLAADVIERELRLRAAPVATRMGIAAQEIAFEPEL